MSARPCPVQIAFPHPPSPLPRWGRGRPLLYFAGGCRPRHPYICAGSGTGCREACDAGRKITSGASWGCKGRSPLHKKTKKLPLPQRGKSALRARVGGMGAESSYEVRGKPEMAGHRHPFRTVYRKGMPETPGASTPAGAGTAGKSLRAAMSYPHITHSGRKAECTASDGSGTRWSQSGTWQSRHCPHGQ